MLQPILGQCQLVLRVMMGNCTPQNPPHLLNTNRPLWVEKGTKPIVANSKMFVIVVPCNEIVHVLVVSLEETTLKYASSTPPPPLTPTLTPLPQYKALPPVQSYLLLTLSTELFHPPPGIYLVHSAEGAAARRLG